MAEIISVINQKGGVGKSTTAYGIGAGLSIKGYRVLFIDLDPQCNLSDTLRADCEGVSALDVLEGGASAQEAVQRVGGTGAQEEAQRIGAVSVIAASSALSGADMILTSLGKEYRLKEALAPVLGAYDFILIDTPPALGVLTINALTACAGVIIPAQADSYSLQGIGQLYSTIETVRKYCNPSLEIHGIVLTRYNPRPIIARDIRDIMAETAEKLGTKLFRTAIREAVAVRESQANRQSIFDYAPKSNPAIDYMELVEEMLEAGEAGKKAVKNS